MYKSCIQQASYLIAQMSLHGKNNQQLLKSKLYGTDQEQRSNKGKIKMLQAQNGQERKGLRKALK